MHDLAGLIEDDTEKEDEIEREDENSEDDSDKEAESEENTDSEGESDSEEESDGEEESEDEEDQPATKKMKVCLPPPEDYISHAFYERGLDALSAVIAYRVKRKLPEYVDAENPLPTNYPIWIEHYSETGMAPPTPKLIEFVKVLDRLFHNIHGDSILKDKNLVSLFTNHMQITYPNIPKKIVSVYAKLRILIRVRALNKRNKNQKKAAADKDKVEKNSRQAEVNKTWQASKRVTK